MKYIIMDNINFENVIKEAPCVGEFRIAIKQLGIDFNLLKGRTLDLKNEYDFSDIWIKWLMEEGFITEVEEEDSFNDTGSVKGYPFRIEYDFCIVGIKKHNEKKYSHDCLDKGPFFLKLEPQGGGFELNVCDKNGSGHTAGHILKITKNGELILYKSINNIFGLKLDGNGSIKIFKD